MSKSLFKKLSREDLKQVVLDAHRSLCTSAWYIREEGYCRWHSNNGRGMLPCDETCPYMVEFKKKLGIKINKQKL